MSEISRARSPGGDRAGRRPPTVLANALEVVPGGPVVRRVHGRRRRRRAGRARARPGRSGAAARAGTWSKRLVERDRRDQRVVGEARRAPRRAARARGPSAAASRSRPPAGLVRLLDRDDRRARRGSARRAAPAGALPVEQVPSPSSVWHASRTACPPLSSVNGRRGRELRRLRRVRPSASGETTTRSTLLELQAGERGGVERRDVGRAAVEVGVRGRCRGRPSPASSSSDASSPSPARSRLGMSIGTYGPVSTCLVRAAARSASDARRRRPDPSWPAGPTPPASRVRARASAGRRRRATRPSARRLRRPSGADRGRGSPARILPSGVVGRVGGDRPDPRDVQRLAHRRAVDRGRDRDEVGHEARHALAGLAGPGAPPRPGTRRCSTTRGIGSRSRLVSRGAFGSWSRRVRTRPPVGATRQRVAPARRRAGDRSSRAARR